MSTVRFLHLGLAFTLLVVVSSDSAFGSVLTNVELGGWEETEPGGGKWDDQHVNNPGPFPNIEGALIGAGLPTAGLTKIVKIEDPNTAGAGLGANFTITGQGTTAGSWSIDQGSLTLTGGKVLAYFSLKAAQSWNLWQVMADIDLNASTYTNAWDTNVSGGGLLTPNGRNFAGLSHITFWAIDPTPTSIPPVVPEPLSAVIWGLLSTGALGFAWARHRAFPSSPACAPLRQPRLKQRSVVHFGSV